MPNRPAGARQGARRAVPETDGARRPRGLVEATDALRTVRAGVRCRLPTHHQQAPPGAGSTAAHTEGRQPGAAGAWPRAVEPKLIAPGGRPFPPRRGEKSVRLAGVGQYRTWRRIHARPECAARFKAAQECHAPTTKSYSKALVAMSSKSAEDFSTKAFQAEALQISM